MRALPRCGLLAGTPWLPFHLHAIILQYLLPQPNLLGEATPPLLCPGAGGSGGPP